VRAIILRVHRRCGEVECSAGTSVDVVGHHCCRSTVVPGGFREIAAASAVRLPKCSAGQSNSGRVAEARDTRGGDDTNRKL
jgi:hypothetical protein